MNKYQVFGLVASVLFKSGTSSSVVGDCDATGPDERLFGYGAPEAEARVGPKHLEQDLCCSL